MNDYKNILITSAGRRVELVKIWKEVSANILGNKFKIFTCDINPEYSAACQISDGSFIVPSSSDCRYVEKVLEKCIELKIGLVIPTIDNCLESFSKSRGLFHNKGIIILISEWDIVEKCRNKLMTKDLFISLGVDYPEIISKNNLKFPLIIKPIYGSSSIGIKIITKKNQLSNIDLNNKNIFMQSFISKEWIEYSVDLLYDFFGNLVRCVPRQRLATRSGEISKGIIKKDKLYDFVFKKFRKIDGARGVLTLQIFADKYYEEFYGIEINARFGGGYPMSFASGSNFPEVLIKEYFFNEKPIYRNDWKEDILFLRYDSTLNIPSPNKN